MIWIFLIAVVGIIGYALWLKNKGKI